MKFKALFVLAVVSLLMLSACEQEQNDPMDFYFCTTSVTDDAQWDLYLDGDLVGTLPFVSAVPACGNTSALSGLLHVTLSEKRYEYQAKDAQGMVHAAGYFQFKAADSGRKKAETGGCIGGSTSNWSCDIVVMSVFE